MKKYMVAVVQMDTQNDKEQNWKQIEDISKKELQN